jgi:hypothetical protein
MPLPQKNIQLHWKSNFGVAFHLAVTAAFEKRVGSRKLEVDRISLDNSERRVRLRIGDRAPEALAHVL